MDLIEIKQGLAILIVVAAGIVLAAAGAHEKVGVAGVLIGMATVSYVAARWSRD